MPRHPFRSIQSRLILLVLLATLPSLGILAYTAHRQMQAASRAAQSETARLLATVAEQQERLVDGANQVLSVLSVLPDVRRQDASACSAILRDLHAKNPRYTTLLAARADGMVFASAVPFTPFSVADRRYFREALAKSAFAFGETVVGRTTGKVTLHLARPAQDGEGHVASVLVAGVDLGQMEEAFARLGLPPGAALKVYDHRGLRLQIGKDATSAVQETCPEGERPRLFGATLSGAFLATDRPGGPAIRAFQQLRGPGEPRPYMVLAVEVPEGEAIQAARRSMRTGLLGLGALTLLAALGALALGHWTLGAPLVSLVATTRRLGAGDWAVSADQERSVTEIAWLARSLDAMRDALRAREAAVLASERRYRTLFDEAPVGLFQCGADGIIRDCNQALATLIGTPKERLVGFPLLERVNHPGMRRVIQEALGGRSAVYEGDYRTVTSGRHLMIRILTCPLPDSGGASPDALAILEDFTERTMQERRQTEAFAQAQRLRSLECLAGGIAHDFNNLLTTLLGNLDLARVKLQRGASPSPHLDMIERAAQRATNLTGQMLAFSGRGAFMVQPIALGALVETLRPELEPQLGLRTRLLVEADADLPPVLADAGQLRQALCSLVRNAAEAIGALEGTITVSATVRDFSEADLAGNMAGQELTPGRFGVLEVRDSGQGMAPEVQTRAFDPFYSTRGSGRGLGLAATLGIVRGHKGGILVRSAPGAGTAFTILLPLSDLEPRIPPSTVAPRPGNRILLVDDEPDILPTLREFMESQGYHVDTAADGVEALERFRAAHGAYDLVLMDVTMPRLGGVEALTAMRQLDPEVRVVLSSGYREEGSLRELPGLAGFLHKPYSFSDLKACLARHLTGR